jgi:hypothetical protein
MTALQLTFHPAAIAEAEDVSRWYGQRSKLAATRFLDEFKLTCRKIPRNPERWPHSSKGIRRVKLPCFPFFLVYRIWTEGWKSLPSPTGIAGRNTGKKDCSRPIWLRG